MQDTNSDYIWAVRFLVSLFYLPLYYFKFYSEYVYFITKKNYHQFGRKNVIQFDML